MLHLHRVLRQALQDAVHWQLLSRNPADAVTAPRPPRTEMQVLDPQEVQHPLRSAEDHPLYGLLYVAIAVGARLGELLALR